MIFHEQHSSGYGFPSLLLATCASAGVSELFLSTRGFATCAARVARSSDGKPYPLECCSWKVTFNVIILVIQKYEIIKIIFCDNQS